MSETSVFLTTSHRCVFDGVPHYQGVAPIMQIAAAVSEAGYEGVRVLEIQHCDGRYIQILQTNHATPEGRYLSKLAAFTKKNKALPSLHQALAHVANLYKTGGARGHK